MFGVQHPNSKNSAQTGSSNSKNSAQTSGGGGLLRSVYSASPLEQDQPFGRRFSLNSAGHDSAGRGSSGGASNESL